VNLIALQGLHAGTNIALDIDQRPMPKGPMFPRSVLLYCGVTLPAHGETGGGGCVREPRRLQVPLDGHRPSLKHLGDGIDEIFTGH